MAKLKKLNANERRSEVLGLKLPIDLANDIKTQAKTKGLTVSTFLYELINMALNENEVDR